MAETETAVDRRDNRDEDCPLCLEPFPPFWDRSRLVVLVCCGKEVCQDCNDKRTAHVERAVAEGSYGKEEEQLLNFCPLCRTKVPNDPNCIAKLMNDKYVKGQLPLRFFHDLGVSYQKGEGGVEKDVEKGLEILMLGAEEGDPCCQSDLGNRYRDGRGGVEISLPEAKRWFLAAAEQGHARAEYYLAFMFKEEGNDAEYVRYLKGSASKGFNNACYLLGVLRYHGKCGLQNSKEEAIRVLTPAAERGHGESMSLLGRILLFDPDSAQPASVPNNFTMGLHWLRRAVEKGDEIAMENLEKLEGLEKLASSTCFRCCKKAPPEKAYLRCSRCRAAWYCSKDCQRWHWKAGGGGHKQVCIKWE